MHHQACWNAFASCHVQTSRSSSRASLNPSNEPGRGALVCRIVSLRTLAAFIATHLGAELVERHGAEHRDPLAEHPERHPHGALAAHAAGSGITLGLKLGDGAVV